MQMIEYETGFGDANITGDTNHMAYFTNLVNKWLHITNEWIQKASGEWTYDDANHGDFAIEVFDFTDEQEDYGLTTDGETDGLLIKRVEVREATGDNDYYDLQYLLEKDRPENSFNEDAGKPLYYYLKGGSIIFYPKPDTASYDKYRLTYDRNAHLFTVSDADSDDLAKPGFDQKFHWILVHGPVMDWAAENKRQDIFQRAYQALFDPKMGLEPMLKAYYNRRAALLGANRMNPQTESW